MEPLIVKAMHKSKLEVYPQSEVVRKSLIVDSSPKLTNNDWIREQSEDSISINQLLKSEKLKSYVAKEMDSSQLCVVFEHCKDLFLKKWITILKSSVEEPLRTHFTVCASETFCL